MNKTQTVALLADFDDPRLTELDLCERHALTLDALLAIAESPPFRHALATLRALRDARAPALLARARLSAARALAQVSDHTPTSLAESRELRLALKDLLRLLGDPGGPARRAGSSPDPAHDDHPGTPTMSKANRGVPEDRDTPNQAAGFPRPTVDAHPLPPPLPSPQPEASREDRGEGSSPSSPYPASSSNERTALAPPPSRQWQVPNPKRPNPKRPRNTKPRPKARSR